MPTEAFKMLQETPAKHEISRNRTFVWCRLFKGNNRWKMNKEAGVGAPLTPRQLKLFRMRFVLISLLRYETLAVRHNLVMELSNTF